MFLSCAEIRVFYSNLKMIKLLFSWVTKESSKDGNKSFVDWYNYLLVIISIIILSKIRKLLVNFNYFAIKLRFDIYPNLSIL